MTRQSVTVSIETIKRDENGTSCRLHAGSQSRKDTESLLAIRNFSEAEPGTT